MSSKNVTIVQRLGSAVFYALCSGLITVVNKLVLTSYGYTMFLIDSIKTNFHFA